MSCFFPFLPPLTLLWGCLLLSILLAVGPLMVHSYFPLHDEIHFSISLEDFHHGYFKQITTL